DRQTTKLPDELAAKLNLELSDDLLEYLQKIVAVVLCSALVKAIKDSGRAAAVYKKLAFELAALLVVGGRPFYSCLTKAIIDIHHFDDYKELMSIIGVALVMASPFNPEIDIFFGSPLKNVAGHNDVQRNKNRLVGFYRNEQKALGFVEIFQSEKKDYNKPWFIDSQIAILDALEAINYETAGILKEVTIRLGDLRGDSDISDTVAERLEQVVGILEKGGRKPLLPGAYERMAGEFEAYCRELKAEDMSLLALLKDVSLKIPLGEHGRPDREAYLSYFSIPETRADPIDCWGLNEALEEARIDYDKSVSLIEGEEKITRTLKLKRQEVIDGFEVGDFFEGLNLDTPREVFNPDFEDLSKRTGIFIYSALVPENRGQLFADTARSLRWNLNEHVYLVNSEYDFSLEFQRIERNGHKGVRVIAESEGFPIPFDSVLEGNRVRPEEDENTAFRVHVRGLFLLRLARIAKEHKGIELVLESYDYGRRISHDIDEKFKGTPPNRITVTIFEADSSESPKQARTKPDNKGLVIIPALISCAGAAVLSAAAAYLFPETWPFVLISIITLAILPITLPLSQIRANTTMSLLGHFLTHSAPRTPHYETNTKHFTARRVLGGYLFRGWYAPWSRSDFTGSGPSPAVALPIYSNSPSPNATLAVQPLMLHKGGGLPVGLARTEDGELLDWRKKESAGTCGYWGNFKPKHLDWAIPEIIKGNIPIVRIKEFSQYGIKIGDRQVCYYEPDFITHKPPFADFPEIGIFAITTEGELRVIVTHDAISAVKDTFRGRVTKAVNIARGLQAIAFHEAVEINATHDTANDATIDRFPKELIEVLAGVFPDIKPKHPRKSRFYLTQLKIKLLQELPLPEAKARRFSEKILALHLELQEKVKQYYGDSEQRIRYTLAPREFNRCADEFIRLIKAKGVKKLPSDRDIQDAFNHAAQNVYFDLFPQKFFEDTAIVPSVPEPDVPLPEDYDDSQLLESVDNYYRAYAKLSRGIDTGKPVLLIRDIHSYDTAELVTDIYAKEHKGTKIRVPLTPFTDRAQIIGVQAPQDILGEDEINRIIERANENQTRLALAIIRDKLPKKRADISSKRIKRLTDDDYAEWLTLKDEHFGLRLAVASALKYGRAWHEKITYEDGILTRMAALAEKNPKQAFFLYFDNIDAASPKVRAQLNQILLFKEMEVPERIGKNKKTKLKLPANLHLIFTMSDRSVLEDAAFYDRFMRKHIDGLWVTSIPKVSNQQLYQWALSIGTREIKQLIAERVGDIALHNPDKVFSDKFLLARKYNIGDLSSRYPIYHRLGGVDKRELIEILWQHMDEAIGMGYLSEAELRMMLPAEMSGQDLFRQFQSDLIEILCLRFGFQEQFANILIGFWRDILAIVARTQAVEHLFIGDVFNIALYVMGARRIAPETKTLGEEDIWRELIAREGYLYMRNKLGGYFAANPLLEGKLIECATRIRPQPISFTFGKDGYLIDSALHRLTINGVGIGIDPGIKDEESLRRMTGLVLTTETVKMLSSFIREEIFGRGIVCLEGPTGIGKTYTTEGHCVMTPHEAANDYTPRKFYCEPIHGSVKIDRWLGYHKVDAWGNYPFYDKTEFVTTCESGGVIAASELNTRVNRDGKASLGYYLIPKARGDKRIPLTEYPRRVKGKKSIVPYLELHKKLLVVIDINPQESYAARGELPDFLQAFIPSVYASGVLSGDDALKLIKAFLSDYKGGHKAGIIKAIAKVHLTVQERIKNKHVGKDDSYVLTIRELYRTCEDVVRGLGGERPVISTLYRALVENYGLFWRLKVDRTQIQSLIRNTIRKTFNIKSIPEEVSGRLKPVGLTESELKAFGYLEDTLLDAKRPVMLLSSMDSRPEKVAAALIKERGALSETMTISYFSELLHIIGGLQPINLDMKYGRAKGIVERFLKINPGRLDELWHSRLGMDKEISEAEPQEIITLAVALNSLEEGEDWNAKLEWREGFITRAVRKYGGSKKHVVLILRNYHRLRPKTAVALNELLQGRVLHLDDGTTLSLPDNISILALAGSDNKLPLSLAEQSRWVRITVDTLKDEEKKIILRDEIVERLADRSDCKPEEVADWIWSMISHERLILERVCLKEDYYFTFWDDCALAKAVIDSLEGEKITYEKVMTTIAKERESIYGVALERAHLKDYIHGDDFINANKGAFGRDAGNLVIDGVRYPIVDPLREEETRKARRRLVEIPRQVAYERATLVAFKQNRLVVMEGPPGGGKTDTAIDIADRLGLEWYLFSSHDRVDLKDFIGEFSQDESGNYILTSIPDAAGHYNVPFLDLYTHGGVFVVDEGAIGNRAQQLIAWLGPIAQGEKELRLEDHPGRDVQVLKRHPKFFTIVTTNPYRDTPGREAIPFEVLAYAQKIRMRKEFTRRDFEKILATVFGNFRINEQEKNEMIKRMIDFHFAIESRIGTDLGEFHKERYYIGIRELVRWAQDTVRIFSSLPDRNLEYAFTEALIMNYFIFVDEKEEAKLKQLVLELLLEKKLQGAVGGVVAHLNKEATLSLKPIDRLFEAYQAFLDDDRFRRRLCDLVDEKLRASLGVIPEFTLQQHLNFVQRNVEEVAEIQREQGGDISSSYYLLTMYHDLRLERSLELADRVVAMAKSEFVDMPVRAFVKRFAERGIDLEIEASLLGESSEDGESAGYCGRWLLVLLTAFKVYQRFHKKEKCDEVADIIVHLLERISLIQDQVNLDDFVFLLSSIAGQLFDLSSSLTQQRQVELIKKIRSFVSVVCLPADETSNLDLILSGLAINAHLVRYVKQDKDLVKRQMFHLKTLIDRHTGLSTKHYAHFYEQYSWRLATFWETLAALSLRVDAKVRGEILSRLEQEFGRLTPLDKFLFSPEDRCRIAIALAQAYKEFDTDKAKVWFTMALDVLDSEFNVMRGNELNEKYREAENRVVSAAGRSNVIETALADTWGCTETEELIELIRECVRVRRLYLLIAERSEGMPADVRQKILDEVGKFAPSNLCEILLQRSFDNAGKWRRDDGLLRVLWNEALRDVTSVPDSLDLTIAENEAEVEGVFKLKESLLEVLEEHTLIGEDLPPFMSEFELILSYLFEMISSARKLGQRDKQEVMAAIFRQVSRLSFEELEIVISPDQQMKVLQLLLRIRAEYQLNEQFLREVESAQTGAAHITEVADRAARSRRSLKITDEDGFVKIGYVRLRKGESLDEERVPKVTEWVEGIFTEETAMRFLANCYDSQRPALFFCEPGSRPNVVIERSAEVLNWELHRVDCQAGMSVTDLIGGLTPVLGRITDRKIIAQERGLLTTHQLEEERARQARVSKILVFYNIDFLSEKVRAALHNFLLKGYIYVTDDNGRRITLVQPKTLHIVATMAANSEKKISDAFFNRFTRTKLRAMEMQKRRFSELEIALCAIYGVSQTVARYIIRITSGVLVLDELGIWPSGNRYNFSIKDAFALARYFAEAKETFEKRGIALSDNKILCQEAYRLFAGAVSDEPSDTGSSDRDAFVHYVLRRSFTKKDLSVSSQGIVLDGRGRMLEMDGVRVAHQEAAVPLFEIDSSYRLSFVPTLISTAGSVLRAFQMGWKRPEGVRIEKALSDLVIITGETGVAKTTLGIDLALALGLDVYVYSTHQGSRASDLTVNIAPDGRGGYCANIKDFARLAQKGYCILVVDEGNIKAQLIQTLAPTARGEKTLQLVLPGDGRRLHKLFLSILANCSQDLEILQEKLGLYRLELFGEKQKKFDKLFGEFKAQKGTRAKKEFIRKFYSFAKSIRLSGPIEIELGPLTFVLVTQNPEMYAGRDFIDPVIREDARKVWASSIRKKSEALAIINGFLGVLDDTLTRKVRVVTEPHDGPVHPVGLDSYHLPSFLPPEMRGGLFDFARRFGKKKEERAKRALIQRDVTFFTSKDIRIVPGEGYSISADGSQMTIPYKQLYYSEPDVITGSIIHEIRHQRYSLSYVIIKTLAEELLNEGALSQEQVTDLYNLGRDRFLNALYQLAENVRTDTIVEPGYEGENEYLETFRKEQFLDSLIERLPPKERRKFQTQLIESARSFPNHAFITELANLAYFGKYSTLFTKYPQGVQDAVKKVSKLFLAATTERKVKPDFEKITTEEDFEEQKRLAVKEFCLRIERDVMPVYKEMVEMARPTYEKLGEEARKQDEQFIQEIEPFIDVREKDGKAVPTMRTKAQASVEAKIAQEFKHLTQLKGFAEDIQAAFGDDSTIQQYQNIEKMQGLLQEVRESVNHLAAMGTPQEVFERAQGTEEETTKKFNEMVDKLWQKSKKLNLKKEEEDIARKKKRLQHIEEVRKSVQDLRVHSDNVMTKINEKSSMTDLSTVQQSLDKTQKKLDVAQMALAKLGASQEAMDQLHLTQKAIAEHMKKVQETIRKRRHAQVGKQMIKELLSASFIARLSRMDQEIGQTEKLIQSNPLTDDLLEAQRSLSMLLLEAHEVCLELAQQNADSKYIEQCRKVRNRVEEVLKSAEDLTRNIKSAEAGDIEEQQQKIVQISSDIS
ncbi:MAG: hypothetical protein JRI96_08230, partial [Deltaproteobacteria bacterium]|nr:hypothetical protein [Deltaproteobacteria bacterium]